MFPEFPTVPFPRAKFISTCNNISATSLLGPHKPTEATSESLIFKIPSIARLICIGIKYVYCIYVISLASMPLRVYMYMYMYIVKLFYCIFDIRSAICFQLGINCLIYSWVLNTWLYCACSWNNFFYFFQNLNYKT